MQTSSKIKRFTFPKSQRLVSKKVIQELFKKGKNQFKYPFKALYLSDSQQNKLPPQILISVSKRNFRSATDRNHLKRRIREIYRLHKKNLLNSENHYPLHTLAIIYVAKEKMPFSEMEEKLVAIFKRLSN